MIGTKAVPTVVLSVDDNPLMGETAELWLRGKPGFFYAGHMLSGKGVLNAIELSGVTLVLLDLDIPGTNVCALIEEIRRASPACKVMILSGHCRANDILDCLAAGAHGYVLKSHGPSYIVAAIEKIANGEPFLCEEAARTAGLS